MRMSKIIPGLSFRSTLVLSILIAQGGCVWFKESKAKLDMGVKPSAHPLANSMAFRDTIGSYTFFDGLQGMRVRGYGVVVGLGQNGSAVCPRPIYEPLVKSLYKQHHFSEAFVGVHSISPEVLIRDLDTAVVLIQGEIPPAALQGQRFDVSVSVVPGTQTKSLHGGRLYTAELLVYRTVSEQVAMTGRPLARASGPIFFNPFSEGESATQSNPLSGVIVGGGVVLEDRRVRLVLSEPSYARALQIQNRINAQFPGDQQVADAVSPSFVRLNVPRAFADDSAHFLSLVRALYLSRDPQFESARVRMLASELPDKDAPHEHIALAFEGIGRTALPVLNDLYIHPDDHVSFHAAVGGLRLGEQIACDAMVMHARNADGAFRFQAIEALARSKGISSAAIALRGLLNDEDPRVRIAAYEALVRRRDAAIQTTVIDKDNFALDRVESTAGNLVYVKRTGRRRIALFGGGTKCVPPIFYRAPDGSLTLNAEPDEETLTALRVAVGRGVVSEPIQAPLQLHPLITLMGSAADVGTGGDVLGLGLQYGAVVRALYYLSRDQAMNAEFVLEQPRNDDILSRPRSGGRPESEL